MQKLLTVAYSSRVSATALSTAYNIDQNAVGRLLKDGEQQKRRIAQAVKQTRTRFKELPYTKREIIYLDETFFRIAKQTWYLILVCDATGRVIAWKLSKTRTATDMSQVLREAEIRHPNWQVLICDGAQSYRKASRMLGKAGMLIQQVHSYPWATAWISVFEPRSDAIEETRIQLPYNFRRKSSRQTIYARSYKHREKKRSKQKRKTPRSKKPARRPRKSFAELAQELQLDANFKLLCSPGEVLGNTVQRALDTVFAIYGDGCIQSNYIESINGKMKQFISTRGIRNPEHLELRLTQLFLQKSTLSASAGRKYQFSMKQLVCGLSACF